MNLVQILIILILLWCSKETQKNWDIDKNKYSWHGSGFPSGKFAKNVIIFGVDQSSSIHVDNKKKDVSILGEGSTQGLDGTTLTAEKKCSINFTVSRRKFRFAYNKANNYLFVNGRELIKFKAKYSEIVAVPLRLERISKDDSLGDMRNTG